MAVTLSPEVIQAIEQALDRGMVSYQIADFIRCVIADSPAGQKARRSVTIRSKQLARVRAMSRAMSKPVVLAGKLGTMLRGD